MTAYWGPALDAEIAYRHEQVRHQFGRRGRKNRTDAAQDHLASADPATAAARPPARVIPVRRTAATGDVPGPARAQAAPSRRAA